MAKDLRMLAKKRWKWGCTHQTESVDRVSHIWGLNVLISLKDRKWVSGFGFSGVLGNGIVQCPRWVVGVERNWRVLKKRKSKKWVYMDVDGHWWGLWEGGRAWGWREKMGTAAKVFRKCAGLGSCKFQWWRETGRQEAWWLPVKEPFCF